MVWNKELKRLGVLFLIAAMTGSIIVNLCAAWYCNWIRAEYNDMLMNVFGNVLKAYPEVREEELVEIVNRGENRGLGRDILAGYGLFEEYGSPSSAVQERQLFFLQAGVNVLFMLFCLFSAALTFGYLGKRQQRIRRLTYYMQALDQRKYNLEIEDNQDDELSGLRNELYKLTVLLREQADSAKASRQALADAVTNISHQLKTPLTSVTVLTDNLSDNPDMERDRRQHFLREIMRQVTGMSWLISTMLKMSRLDVGVVELKPVRLNVEGLIREVAGRLELAAEWKNVSFLIEIPDDAVLQADRKWTEEAMLNIVKNAVEYSPVGGTVDISGEDNSVYTQIAVKDHGEGIAEEEREKLFRRFYNGKSSREDSMGIGLALAKEIIERQNGYITVDSRAGEGTLFVIRFLKQGE